MFDFFFVWFLFVNFVGGFVIVMCVFLLLDGMLGDGCLGWFSFVLCLCFCFFLFGNLLFCVINWIFLFCIWGSFVVMFLFFCEFWSIFVIVIGSWFEWFSEGSLIDFFISFLKVFFVWCLVFCLVFIFELMCFELLFMMKLWLFLVNVYR